MLIVGSQNLDVLQLSYRFVNHADGPATCACAGEGVCRSAAARSLRINRMFLRESGARFCRNLTPRPLLNPACFFESSSATRIRVYMNHGKQAKVCSEGAFVLCITLPYFYLVCFILDSIFLKSFDSVYFLFLSF